MCDTIKLVKLACGRHWGLPTKHKAGDKCMKCYMHARDEKLLQHNGIPWAALRGPLLPTLLLEGDKDSG